MNQWTTRPGHVRRIFNTSLPAHNPSTMPHPEWSRHPTDEELVWLYRADAAGPIDTDGLLGREQSDIGLHYTIVG